MATLAERIAALDALIGSGATAVRDGSKSVDRDLAELRRERARLVAEQAALSGATRSTRTLLSQVDE